MTTPETESGCAPKQRAGSATSRGGLLASAGAVFTAVLSSACCWLPLLLVAFGVSGAGVAGVFETYRPYLLGGTGVLLALGFYVVYFRRSSCADGTCSVPGKLERLSKLTLWGASVLALLFALFPSYVGDLLALGADERPAVEAGRATTQRTLAVEGMTCDGCSVAVEAQLRKVAGVLSARVSYPDERAGVELDSRRPPSDEALLAAVKRAGYSGHVIGNEPSGEKRRAKNNR